MSRLDFESVAASVIFWAYFIFGIFYVILMPCRTGNWETQHKGHRIFIAWWHFFYIYRNSVICFIFFYPIYLCHTMCTETAEINAMPSIIIIWTYHIVVMVKNRWFLCKNLTHSLRSVFWKSFQEILCG